MRSSVGGSSPQAPVHFLERWKATTTSHVNCDSELHVKSQSVVWKTALLELHLSRRHPPQHELRELSSTLLLRPGVVKVRNGGDKDPEFPGVEEHCDDSPTDVDPALSIIRLMGLGASTRFVHPFVRGQHNMAIVRKCVFFFLFLLS